MAGHKMHPGVARRKGRDGRPLPGYYFRYAKADGKRTIV